MTLSVGWHHQVKGKNKANRELSVHLYGLQSGTTIQLQKETEC